MRPPMFAGPIARNCKFFSTSSSLPLLSCESLEGADASAPGAINEARSNNPIAIDVVFITALFARKSFPEILRRKLFGRNSTGEMDWLSAFAAQTIIAERPSQSGAGANRAADIPTERAQTAPRTPMEAFLPARV